MTTYSIFNQKHDCEIWVDLSKSSLDNIEAIRKIIIESLDNDHELEGGSINHYKLGKVQWEIVGGKFEPDFDFNQVLEVPTWERTL